MSYNFENLSPLDFEKLGIDLLQASLGIQLIETFAPGPDWCIDGRFVDNSGKKTIIQCKHFVEFSNLKQELKKETEKIKSLSKQKKIPQLFNYILITSLKLTPQKKNDLKGVIPYLQKDNDIYGREDLNNLIKQYPDIEKNHFKLWLDSTAVLKRIFSNDIYNQTDFEIDSIKKEMKLYVETDNLRLVNKKLEKNKFCIISGIPGVGKTTLAKMLIFKFLMKDFDKKTELVVIKNNIREALNVYSSKKRMLFYYDDFLGTTFLNEALPKNEDSQLIDFIDKIRTDENKRFILTTREYILNQAFASYEKMGSSDLLSSKFIIRLEQYSPKDKAKILFNHLYFSEIDKEYLQNLKDNKRYRDIVRHRNFNPRLIKFMGKKDNLRNVAYNRYSDWCIQNLDNPGKIWEGAFNNISSNSKALLYYLITMPRPLVYNKNEFKFNSFYNKYCNKYNLSLISNPLKESIKEIGDTFISLEQNRDKSITIEFINPSVNDFLEFLIKKDKILTKNLIEISSYPIQLQKVIAILNSENEDKFLDILRDTEIQKSILELTKNKQKNKKMNNIFSLIFNSISDEFLDSNKSFLQELLDNFIRKFKSPKYKENISLSECINCLDILEEKNPLYFGKKEELLEKAKKAFCHDIDGLDFVFVEKFMSKFPSTIDEQTKNHVFKEVHEAIGEWYRNAKTFDSPEDIREIANDMCEIEEIFDIDGYSEELYGLADEIEMDIEREEEERKREEEEYPKYESVPGWYIRKTQIKKEPSITNEEMDKILENFLEKESSISNEKLDEMFKKL